MSKFSGKCDLCDHIEIVNDENRILHTVYYVGDYNDTPLEVHDMKDLIPYYPYVISMAVCSEERSVVRLTSKSYVDCEEEDILNFYLKQVEKYEGKCKRKRIPFEVEDAVKVLGSICFGDTIRILAERVKNEGKKATIEGIHLASHEFYRKELVKEMEKNGLDPRKYGYARFSEK